MAKADTIIEIKAKHGAEAPDTLTQKQLDALLAAPDRAAFDTLLAEYTQEEPVAEDGKIRVRVRTENPKVAEGSAYLHPVTKVLITGDKKGVTVPEDDWTLAQIEARVLIPVK